MAGDGERPGYIGLRVWLLNAVISPAIAGLQLAGKCRAETAFTCPRQPSFVNDDTASMGSSYGFGAVAGVILLVGVTGYSYRTRKRRKGENICDIQSGFVVPTSAELSKSRFKISEDVPAQVNSTPVI